MSKFSWDSVLPKCIIGRISYLTYYFTQWRAGVSFGHNSSLNTIISYLTLIKHLFYKQSYAYGFLHEHWYLTLLISYKKIRDICHKFGHPHKINDHKLLQPGILNDSKQTDLVFRDGRHIAAGTASEVLLLNCKMKRNSFGIG